MEFASLLNTLLKGKNPSSFTAYDIDSKAYYRVGKKQYLEAAVLFEAAAKQAQIEYDTIPFEPKSILDIHTNHFLTSYYRSALNYFRAGHVDIAIPMLEHVVSANWKEAKLFNDTCNVADAYVYLLAHAANKGLVEFEHMLLDAKSTCNDYGFDFPQYFRMQSQLFEYARQCGAINIQHEMLDRMAKSLQENPPRKGIRTLRQQLKEYQKSIESS